MSNRSIDTFLQQANTDEVRNWIKRIVPTYEKRIGREAPQTEIEHIIDYLNSPQATKRLFRMSYEQAKSNAEKWVKALQKRGQDIAETDADVEVVMRSRDGAFTLVRLVGEAAFKREGFLMRHCVASYADRTDTEVFSLRDMNNEPHCTFEVTKGGDDRRINQVKGKGNGPIHPKYISYVLKILRYFKFEVRESEMSNLGYKALSPEYWKILLSVRGEAGIRTVTFKGTKYLYVGRS
jgi:hypothetical protein